ncbi:MAG: LLM class flavin-dependent oxidoreductase [Chromatiales bacterium]|nr:LLM class flavin-dependent oxidoreductase [Chromatiales bacterium]
MSDQHGTRELIALAERAEDQGFDSLWVGDSLFARARHEPLTLLAGVATRTSRVDLGTAVLLPALRNPVVMAQQVATLDQLCEGRLILGLGIAADGPSIRAEFEAAGVPFEKRVGRMLEGLRLCRALWKGEPVNWDGRWHVADAKMGPRPYREGGPPIWGTGTVPAALTRAARNFDGWFPTGPAAAKEWGDLFTTVKREAADFGRDPETLTGAVYLTVAVDDDAVAANARIDNYLESYYGVPAHVMRARQACFGGSLDGLAQWLDGFSANGAQVLVVRFAGDHERHLDLISRVRTQLGW